MALVIRGSCFHARPKSPQSRPSHIFSGKCPTPGKVASLQYRVERFALSFGDISTRPCENRSILPSREGMHRRLDGLCKLEGSCIINQMLPVCGNFLKWLFPDEAKLLSRSKMMELLVINALTLATPFEALAETCEPENSVFNMPLLLFIALIGATVGGLLARQRKGELEKLNEQLRQINAALRRQAKIESYAPSLSYAPVGARISENEVIVDPRKEELISHLKAGKNFLRNQDPEAAFAEFKQALELAQTLTDPTEQKKAARGLGASLQRQGKYREAIKYHSLVLGISEQEGEDSGNTEAYGAIADCYTELGDLERAGKFYDEYISRLETD
ncbi:protein FLUORESCENT IN BLUE LIGHT, chloroplastic isoform X1 [Tripterygium wilfordii]|uniref:protein FLUORESCENT IN BLUE LIGHT, chloroplastic isoform X1 n=1 Tax=Tripterygium wilfordii TaxID=458696 RepID=UPI0018F82D85|nr:protein FLUORESCENT IN BLUE LIGHT, chloroplastic isoform X1 [Tripterygium wilfordii]